MGFAGQYAGFCKTGMRLTSVNKKCKQKQGKMFRIVSKTTFAQDISPTPSRRHRLHNRKITSLPNISASQAIYYHSPHAALHGPRLFIIFA
jgi:hypothetical protein